MTAPVYLSEADHDRVSVAVAAAESHSSGEIVTILTEQSDGYSDIALAWCAAVAILALAALALAPDFYLGLWERLVGGWVLEWQPGALFAFAAFVAAAKFAGMWLLQLWRPLRFWLVPAPIRHARVRHRAVACFKIGAERRTHGRTGVLIYLSMREHRAEIVADAAIADKVDPDAWGAALAAMLGPVREGRIADGLCAGIAAVGSVLAEHLPRAPDDQNELPDRLIEV